MASEAFFNLRSALDYTAWELAKWNLQFIGSAAEPFSRTQYPIATEEGRFQEWQLKDLHPNHVAVIKWLQPWSEMSFQVMLDEMARHPGIPSGQQMTFTPFVYTDKGRALIALSHPLDKVRSINDHDKHRTLKAIGVSSGISEVGDYAGVRCTVAAVNVFSQAQLNSGAKWAEIDIVPLAPNPEVVVNDRITPALTFGGDNILSVFPTSYAFVRRVIGAFWPVWA
jgi:hypothetical protein